MIDYICFWLAKTFADVFFGLFIMFTVLMVIFLISVPSAVRQSRCKHERFRETSACDAICCNCGKNLGFIGAVREDRSKEEA